MTLFNVIPTSSSIPFILLFTSTTTTSLLFYYIMTFSMIMMMIPTIQGQIASTDGCISLQGSNSCRGFQHYYIGTTAINNLLSVDASTFNTISDLDDALIDYTHTSSDYMSPLGCIADSTNTTGNNSTTYPYARYALSRLCAGLVQDTQTSLPCNYAKNIQPLPLCQSTCQEWVDSVTNMTNTTTVCTNISQRRQQALLQLDDSCQSWSGYNGHSPQCINGTTNEPDNCGK
ncbi:hypothetical protein BJ944DRAFT_167930 [Cunninghamella echinulata]|nr:hypothetical protein BJ944DRAFT_167930 [Cunninghamella echinulata]